MKLKALSLFFLPVFLLTSVASLSQSNNCATATQITLSSGAACVNGTTVGAITDNILYGACNTVAVNMVWYTYVTNGSNNTFTVTPGSLTNAEIVIYTGACPTGGMLQTCNTASGSAVLNTTWGLTAGTQVWIGVASNNGTQGTFQLCVNSTPPAPGPGNTCAQAIPLCSNATFSKPTMAVNSSGQQPTCFLDPPQRDIWLKFTVTNSGTLAWTATPTVSTTEFDWALWDVTSGCPGTVVCCNYHYGNNALGTNPVGSASGFGMQAIVGNGACGIQTVSVNTNKEFCPPAAVTCGRTYAIQISNYNNTNAGFTLNFTNSTCTIGGNASFTVSPPLTCGASTTATITDASTGDCAAVWTYGDGTSYTGPTPPSHTYSTPGTYAITEVINGACPSNHTEYVQLLGPLSATATATNESCAGSCNGTASVTAVTGGDGVYTYSWSTGATTSSVSGLCAGTYTVTISNTICGTSITKTVTVTSPVGTPLTVNSPSICSGGSATLTASGATTYTWTPSTGLSATTGASVTANPTVTTTYTVSGSTGGCTSTNTSTVTVTPTPTVTVNSASYCPGGSATLTASGATTYSWTPSTGLSATTGASVTANPAATTTYTITGTTSTCTATATSTVTVAGALSIAVNSATICPAASATLTATGGTTYTWAPSTGLSATSGSTVTASPAVTTTYTVTGSTGACSGTATSTVTISPSPTVAVNSPTICAGGSATLTASGATTYSWSPSTGLSATTGASVTANPAATTTYTITGTTAGCNGTASSTVTVNALPVVSVNSPTICAGSSGTLTASGATTYSWTPSAGLSSTTGASVTANPAATTTYIVTGTTAGCDGTASSTVTVNPLPVVTVNSATVCAGTSATLTASGATTYSWTPSTGLSATTGAGVTANPATTTTYTVTGTTSGCDGTASSTVTVNALPVVAVNSPTICVGSPATLTASGATTYSWTPSTGLSSTTGASVTANPATTTTYTITGTTSGCDGTVSSTVTVNPLPVVIVNSATVCAGSSGTLTASGATTYSWTPSTGLSATTGASVTANPVATTTYTVTGTTNGCDGTASSTVTVNALPVVAVNSATVCAGTSATLNASGATTYSWTPSAGLSATTGASVTANPAVTTTYTVTGTTSGCDGTASSTVTVNALPVVAVNSPTTCLGGSATLTASGATSYSWTPATGLSATTGASVTANPAATTTYTVTGTTSGCDGSATSTVTIGAAPVVTVTASSFSVCAGASTTITAGGASTYTWTPSTGLSATSGTSVAASPSATTAYTVTETGSGCSGSTTFTVTVNPLPTVTASNAGPYCVNDASIQLTGTSTATSFSWQGPDSFTSLLQNPAIAPATTTAAGVYTVTVRDANLCQNSATTNVVVNPLPVVLIGNNSPVCETAALNLTSSNQTTATGNTYSWSGPGTPSFSSTSQNPSIPAATPAMNGTYTVTIKDANNCVNTNTTAVTITPKPAAPAVTGVNYCLNGTASPLSATASPGGTLNWYGVNPSGSPSPTASIPNTASPGPAIYYVSQTIAGCESDKANIPVQVNLLPTGTLNTINAACVPLCDQFVFTSSSVLSSYTWNMGNGTTSSAGNTISHCYSESGDYSVSVTVTDNAGCTNTLPFANWVHVKDVPAADFVYTPDAITILDPVTTFYDYSIGSGIISTTWTIFHHDTLLLSTTEAQPSYIFPEADTFDVQLTVVSSYGCSNTITKPVVVKNEYTVYIPNAFSPDNDNINEEFRVEGVGITKVNMMIFNRWGETIFRSSEPGKGWNGRDSKNNKVEKGVYIYKVEVTNDLGVQSQRTGHVTVVR